MKILKLCKVCLKILTVSFVTTILVESLFPNWPCESYVTKADCVKSSFPLPKLLYDISLKLKRFPTLDKSVSRCEWNDVNYYCGYSGSVSFSGLGGSNETFALSLIVLIMVVLLIAAPIDRLIGYLLTESANCIELYLPMMYSEIILGKLYKSPKVVSEESSQLILPGENIELDELTEIQSRKWKYFAAARFKLLQLF